MTEREILSLARMLEFRTQLSREDARRVLALFDRYFDAYVRHAGFNDRLDAIRSKMKLYYLPVLFLTDKALSTSTCFHILRRRVGLLWDVKLYRKIAKIALGKWPRRNEKEGFEPSAW